MNINQFPRAASRTGAFLLLLGLYGCSETPSRNPPVTDGDAKVRNPVVDQPQPLAADKVDRSLPSAEYVRLGVPAPDRVWSADDMAQAFKVLDSLAQRDLKQLPRHQSEQSGAVFARLVAADNLAFARDRNLPLNVRLPQMVKYFEFSNRTLKLYMAAFAQKSVRDSDIIEMLGGILRTSAATVEVVDEFIPTIRKDDPKFDVRMAGLRQMKQGLAITVTGALIILTEKGLYRVTERVKFIGYLNETVPVIAPRLNPEAQAELVTRLANLVKDPALQELQPGLSRLEASVQQSLKRS